MSLFLAIETATPNCSVALFENSILLSSKELDGGYTHAENLVPFVEQLLESNKLKPSQIDAVAVSEGPGSYTGLRIGVSFAKGFCFFNNTPLIAINTLKAMSAGALTVSKVDEGSLLCPMIDARRDEVYTCLFDTNLDAFGNIHPHILDDASFKKELEQMKVFFFGDGAIKAKEIIKSNNAVFLEKLNTSAISFGGLIYNSYQKKDFVDLAYFQPFYLKNFKAGKPKKLV